MGDAHMAMQARLMCQALQKLSRSLSLSQMIIIFTNKVRAKLSTFPGFAGLAEIASGGNALKIYASVCLNIKSRSRHEWTRVHRKPSFCKDSKEQACTSFQNCRIRA